MLELADTGKRHLEVVAQRSVVGDERQENRARLETAKKDAPAGWVLKKGGRFLKVLAGHRQ